MSIQFIKLASGEDILAEVTETDNEIVVENPVVLNYGMSEEGLQMSFLPWPFCAKTSQKLNINKDSIVLKGEPLEDLVSGYREKFGSGIVIPKKDVNLNLIKD